MDTWEQRMAKRAQSRHGLDGPDSDYWTGRRREFKYIEASDDFIADLGDEQFNEQVQREARDLIAVDYDASLYLWNKEPLNDVHCKECQEPICQKCSQWRRYGKGQRHFGYTWWGVCNMKDCDCAHHRHEVWMASVA